MAILAIDTSTLTASAAVVGLDGAVLATIAGDPASHSDRVIALCEDVLARAGVAAGELDAIAVGAGPGSFTGLRIGLSTGKGLAYGLGRPLWLASSLAALAWDLGALVDGDDLLVPILDARRSELYVGFYRRAGATLIAVGPERVIPPAELPAAIAAYTSGAAHLAGDALTIHAAALAALPTTITRWPSAPATPSAAGVAHAALASDRADLLTTGAPTYIRPSEAEVKYPTGVPGARPR